MRRVSGWLIAVISLLLACFLLIQSWMSLTDRPAQTNPAPAGSVLLLTAADQDAGQYRLLKVGLTSAGFAVADCRINSDTATNRQTILDAAAELKASTLSTKGVWLVSTGNGAAETWLAGSQLEAVAGILMLAPQNLASLSFQDIEQRINNLDVAIFAAPDAKDGLNGASRAFFEQLTGEDTTLFPAYQQNLLKPLQYTSANGQTWLMIYPGLTLNWSLLSVRVLPDVANWLEDWSAANNTLDTDQSSQAAKLLITLVFQLLLAGILLLAVPLGLNFALAAKTTEQIKLSSTEQWHRIITVLLWLPGAALAAALSLLISRLTGHQTGWLLLALLLLPGCRGWFFVLGRLISDNRRSNNSKSNQAQEQKSIKLSGIAGLLVVILTVLAAVLWDWLAFGTLQPAGWSWLLVPVLIVVSWPAGLTGTVGQIGLAQQNGQAILYRWHQSIWQHLPFLLLPFWAVFAYGMSGLAASLLLLTVQLWSLSIGKAVTLLGFHPAVGSLLQAIGWATCLFIPSIMNAFIG